MIALRERSSGEQQRRAKKRQGTLPTLHGGTGELESVIARSAIPDNNESLIDRAEGAPKDRDKAQLLKIDASLSGCGDCNQNVVTHPILHTNHTTVQHSLTLKKGICSLIGYRKSLVEELSK